ncbi:hypothetical protein GQR58_029150 [Nymphon striatum]|nr:hypothetical protein GQR58_029150 [Nymphon striatum]
MQGCHCISTVPIIREPKADILLNGYLPENVFFFVVSCSLRVALPDSRGHLVFNPSFRYFQLANSHAINVTNSDVYLIFDKYVTSAPSLKLGMAGILVDWHLTPVAVSWTINDYKKSFTITLRKDKKIVWEPMMQWESCTRMYQMDQNKPDQLKPVRQSAKTEGPLHAQSETITSPDVALEILALITSEQRFLTDLVALKHSESGSAGCHLVTLEELFWSLKTKWPSSIYDETYF